MLRLCLAATAVFLLVSTAVAGVPSRGAGPTAIDAAHTALGGNRGGLGAAQDRERCGLRAGGCFRTYEYGVIYWSARSGAQPVWGYLGAAWDASAAQNGALGYPLGAPACAQGTCSQDFERGSISWTAAAGAQVLKDIDNPASLHAVVNKQRPLAPASYHPDDLVAVGGYVLRAEAAAAFAGMQAAAAGQGVEVRIQSAYRSFDMQSGLYGGYVQQYGADVADTFSARPGHSEHQTGAALDIADGSGACTLQSCFSTTPAGSWAAENAHLFGFIVRYPGGADAVTGYSYEPWHLRYVGAATAAAMQAAGVATLEEFMALPPAPDY